MKNDNIDLFAAGDRKVQTPTLKPKTKDEAQPELSSTPAGLQSRASVIEARAELLRLEAEKEQLDIDQLRLQEDMERLKDIDRVITKLFDGSDWETVIKTNRLLLRKELFFRLLELANAASTEPEKQKYLDAYDLLLMKIKKDDAVLHAELTTSIKQEMKAEFNRMKGQQPKQAGLPNSAESLEQVLEKWVQQTMGRINASDPSQDPLRDTQAFPPMSDFNSRNFVKEFGEGLGNETGGLPLSATVIRYPSYLPINMMPLMLRSDEISRDDMAVLKEAVFTEDVLTDIKMDDSGYLATFSGIPVGSLDAAFQKINRRIELVPGMQDRVRVFLLPDYVSPIVLRQLTNQTGLIQEKYSGLKFRPVFTVLSKSAVPKKQEALEYIVNLVAFGLTIISTFIYATDVNALNAKFLEQALAGDLTVVDKVVPIALGVLGLQAVHDVGHNLAAAFYRLPLSVSYSIPSLQIGIFGTITNFMDFPRTRKEFFDVSIMGPVFGFVASLACTVIGLSLTQQATSDMLAGFPALPTGFFTSSFLLYEMVDSYLHISEAIAAGASTAAATASAINPDGVLAVSQSALTTVHPLVAVGMTGLLANAFNFMPIGRLDGGRAVTAIFGRRTAQSVAFATLIGQAFALFDNSSPVLFFWLLTVVFLQRGQDIPPVDDATPVATDEDDKSKGVAWFGRLSAFLFCALLTGAILLPAPIDPSLLTDAASSVGDAAGAGAVGGSQSIFQGFQI